MSLRVVGFVVQPGIESESAGGKEMRGSLLVNSMAMYLCAVWQPMQAIENGQGRSVIIVTFCYSPLRNAMPRRYREHATKGCDGSEDLSNC